jgi:hypothetical protein
MKLTVWRLHPGGCRIEKAEKTLKGTANKGATKWCGPYSTANSMGWWLYPPSDIDIMYKGEGAKKTSSFEYRHVTEYNDYDHHYIRSLVRKEDNIDPTVWCPRGGRTKYTWGVADDNVCQIWTGCIFQTPPDWCLMMRSPVNTELPHRLYNVGPICSVQEGVLETDWMQYDIWINLQFHVQSRWVYLRRNQKLPIAQIIPVHRSALEDHKLEERVLERQSEEGEKVFQYWTGYNHKKYGKGGKQHASSDYAEIMKDSTTFFREKKAAVCPYAVKQGEEPLVLDSSETTRGVEVEEVLPTNSTTLGDQES